MNALHAVHADPLRGTALRTQRRRGRSPTPMSITADRLVKATVIHSHADVSERFTIAISCSRCRLFTFAISRIWSHKPPKHPGGWPAPAAPAPAPAPSPLEAPEFRPLPRATCAVTPSISASTAKAVQGRANEGAKADALPWIMAAIAAYSTQAIPNPSSSQCARSLTKGTRELGRTPFADGKASTKNTVRMPAIIIPTNMTHALTKLNS